MNSKLRLAGTYIPATELILQEDGRVYHLGITGDAIAEKVIIVGDPERAELIATMFDEVTHLSKNREFVVARGIFKDKDLTVVSSGIGVDNIDIVINELDAALNVDPLTRCIRENPRHIDIVRIGTCGGLQEDLAPGTFVVSGAAIGVDNVPFSYDHHMSIEELALLNRWHEQGSHIPGQYATLPNRDLLDRIGFDMIKGITITSNGFYGPQGRNVRIPVREAYQFENYLEFEFAGMKLTNLEMECSGLYALASLLGHRALTVCAIMANRVTKEFHRAPSVSIESLISTVLARI